MQKKIIVAIVFILLLISLVSHLNTLGLRGEEPRRALVGIETYVNNNYVVPHILGETYYNKPPMYNWLLALFFFIFQSVSEWVVRLPGILSFLGTGGLIYFFTKKYIGKKEGLLAAAFYFTSIELLFVGTINTAEIDFFYALIVSLQAFVIFHFAHKEKYKTMYLLSYALTFVGLMTKGLPSLVFQASTLLVLFIYLKKWRILFSWKHVLSIFLFFGTIGFYFLLFNQEDNLQNLIVNQVFQSSDKSFNNSSPLAVVQFVLQFPVIFLRIMLPWSLLLILLFIKQIRNQITGNILIQFSILFILANIPIYWLSPAIRPRYLYMFFPFAAIITATIFLHIRNQETIKKWLNGFGYALIAASFLTIWVFPFVKKVSQYTVHLTLINISFTAFFVILFFIYYKYKNLKIHTLITLLILGRIWINLTIFPYFHETSKVKDYYIHTDKMAQITNNEPIIWTGSSINLKPSIKLFGKQLIEVFYSIPAELPYSIPYSYFKKTGHVFKYEPIPTEGKFYLAGDTLIDKSLNIDTLYQFKEFWYNRNLLLFTVKEK